MTVPGAKPGPAGNADHAEIGKFDAIAHRFWDPHGEFRPLHLINPVRVGYVAERCQLEGARVLDIGCGGGLLCEALQQLGAQVTGIDLAPAMLDSARLHAAERGVAIDYRMLAAESLAHTEPASFDVITCMEMIEHVPDPASIVRSIATLLRPGGAAFLSTLNRTPKSFVQAIVAAEYLLRLLPRGTHEYERLVRPSELAQWGRTAGLTLQDVRGLAFDPFTAQASLSRDASVNYLAHFSRETCSGLEP
ncbi:MAG TPA: bifunctional 2-polyprenyl-6-hydroxyphenol methylase/3-demethylubiquinol 3-O-methyltransferase UbiG [Steroidobacteraceae bacterium]|jgi:2-polyprenyl-6-hydroxyphenyl methylase/3-demethylubiquinone-9 3-methyltransferase|nr:bifunctional 2-polyprenyl-6-hydroxyphenol methylase/3-demethylubiquinol 3-O-methyltransferase UbiG [Steroidobacteraceae bacterium]